MTAPTLQAYANPDMSQVDELAVDFVCNGTPMDLNRDSTVVAVRRMCGVVPNGEIARRCRTYKEEVSRILKASGAVNCRCRQYVWPGQQHLTLMGTACEGLTAKAKRRCPVCCREVMPTGRGNIARHRDSIGRDVCPASGETFELAVVGVAS